MRLYLAAMLQRQPVITDAIVSSLNGSRFVDVYCPVYGMECRLYTAEIGVSYDWDSKNKCASSPATIERLKGAQCSL